MDFFGFQLFGKGNSINVSDSDNVSVNQSGSKEVNVKVTNGKVYVNGKVRSVRVNGTLIFNSAWDSPYKKGKKQV